jgi:glycosyltransferase involved in cell wall biosynthesis
VYRYSIVIPVYRNEENIRSLLDALRHLAAQFDNDIEFIFVIDGSPDRSWELLRSALPGETFGAQLIAHSRNFGSFAALHTGLRHARGAYIAVMAADLQEPPELFMEMFKLLSQDEADIVFGQRISRADPAQRRLLSTLFWRLYRVLALRDMPVGGVDIFACTERVREAMLSRDDSPGTIVMQLLWMGFRRAFVPYQRRSRSAGRSAWSFRRRLNYFVDSMVSFTDRPIHALFWFGTIGIVASLIATLLLCAGWLTGRISVPSYAVAVLLLVFMSSVQICGLGIIGFYLWRSSENLRRRSPLIMSAELFDKTTPRAS